MAETDPTRRSTCPVNAALEVLGDRWSLLIVRDLMFGGARTYSDFRAAPEAIATNILASRLASLQAGGILTSAPDPEDGRRHLYRLTEKGIALAPALLELGRWGIAHEGAEPPPGLHAAYDADREGFMAALRARLLDAP
ncbi:winged helix-turn-helix transcriptional regulator [Devosia sp.]|uniref:winged helix-turn-helix transcriptional regulator n=1 Tax=Devosia sp. TaxID=1871048 RepID=UPI003A8D7C7E